MSITALPPPSAVSGPTAALPFDEQTSVREILRRWPTTRAAFDEAGLMGCGGAQGPDEPLAFFAEVHRVPLESLKRSLALAIGQPAGRVRRELPIAPTKALTAEPAHRYVPFLLSSVVLTLTFGATLGMINLARLTTPWFGGMTTGSVRAHAFVQVFGFLGLFIVGVASHVLPRFSSRPLGASHAHVRAMLGVQLAGIGACVAAFMGFDETVTWLWAAGSGALTIAGALFLVMVARTVAPLWKAEPFVRWVLAGSIWQVAIAAASLLAALRDDVGVLQAIWPAALWGFAGSWVFGVGRRIFPGFLAWHPRAPRAERIAFVVYQMGVVLAAAAAWPLATEPPLVLTVSGALGLAVAVPWFSWCLGIGRGARTPHQDVERGYQRFIWAAWIWLGVALLLGPVWSLAAAFTGGATPRLVTDFSRHALAFGFVTQIMMGVASRVLPVFTGNALWSPRARTAAFYLLNASLVVRALEAAVAAGFVPEAWPLIAAAGPPAVAAVVLFGLNVAFTIDGRPAAAPVRPTGAVPLAERRVSDILGIAGALDVLVGAGFKPLQNPIMRATFATRVTLRQVCAMKGVALEPLVERLGALEPKPLRVVRRGPRTEN